jgi:hypothetical protein
MEPEEALSCSQEPATGPYPELDEFSAYPHIYFAKINFNILMTAMSYNPDDGGNKHL